MKISILRSAIASAMFSFPIVAISATDEALENKIETLEQRLEALESQADNETQTSARSSIPQAMPQGSNNSFNPAISVILEGAYASYKNKPEDYVLPGYALGGEAGLASEGFSLGHSEIILSSNIDDKFFGQFTLAVAEHDGETELEIEEAFFETLSLGNAVAVFIPLLVILISSTSMPGTSTMHHWCTVACLAISTSMMVCDYHMWFLLIYMSSWALKCLPAGNTRLVAIIVMLVAGPHL